MPSKPPYYKLSAQEKWCKGNVKERKGKERGKGYVLGHERDRFASAVWALG